MFFVVEISPSCHFVESNGAGPRSGESPTYWHYLLGYMFFGPRAQAIISCKGPIKKKESQCLGSKVKLSLFGNGNFE